MLEYYFVSHDIVLHILWTVHFGNMVIPLMGISCPKVCQVELFRSHLAISMIAYVEVISKHQNEGYNSVISIIIKDDSPKFCFMYCEHLVD